MSSATGFVRGKTAGNFGGSIIENSNKLQNRIARVQSGITVNK